jgi:Big-like domain-containing protein
MNLHSTDRKPMSIRPALDQLRARIRIGLTFLLISALSARAQSSSSQDHPQVRGIERVLSFLGDRMKIEGTAGAGFAGIHVAEQLERPALNPCQGSSACVRTASDTSVLLQANVRYAWRPAISTGVATHVYTNAESGAGIGLGVQVVFVPASDGTTSPFPATTLHVGTRQTEVFFGIVWSPTDEVRFPNGQDTITVHRTASSPAPSFVLPNVHRARNLYMGIQINGFRQSQTSAQQASNATNVYAVNFTVPSKALDSLELGATLPTKVELTDASNHQVYTRIVFTSTDTTIATVDGNSGLITTKKPGGPVTIAATADGKSGSIKIVVMPKKSE